MNGLKKYPKIWLLVALALLVSACQTSQPPVHQYQWLSFMEHSVYNSVKSNEERLQSFKRRIKGTESSSALEMLKNAELLRQKVTTLRATIDKVKSRLIQEAGLGFNSKTHLPKDPLNVQQTRIIMREEAPILSKKLNDFTDFIAAEYKSMPQLERLGDGFPTQSFYETYFEKANLVEALMTLTQRQGAILRYQEEVMKKECLDC